MSEEEDSVRDISWYVVETVPRAGSWGPDDSHTGASVALNYTRHHQGEPS